MPTLYAPRVLTFSYFKQKAVVTVAVRKKKKLAGGGYIYVACFFYKISRSRAEWGKIKEIPFCV